jgi:hypothetical protein
MLLSASDLHGFTDKKESAAPKTNALPLPLPWQLAAELDSGSRASDLRRRVGPLPRGRVVMQSVFHGITLAVVRLLLHPSRSSLPSVTATPAAAAAAEPLPQQLRPARDSDAAQR